MSHVSLLCKYMQISTAIINKYLFCYISTNIADKWTNKVSRHMFWGPRIIIKLFLKWPHVSMPHKICKLGPTLPKNYMLAFLGQYSTWLQKEGAYSCFCGLTSITIQTISHVSLLCKFMQISAAIIQKYPFHYISTNIAD